jgi:small subunit ribosomal protein S12e
MSDAGDNVEVEAPEVAEVSEAPKGKLSVEEALEVNSTVPRSICASEIPGGDQQVLKKSLKHDGLARGLRECAKALDRRQAYLCVLVETCTEAEYIKLIEALCATHTIPLIKVGDAKVLGKWAGLCKIDRDGNARKIVGCSCVVVKEYGEDSEARHVLDEYFKAR